MVMPEGTSALSAVARRRLRQNGSTPPAEKPLSPQRQGTRTAKRARDAHAGNGAPEAKKLQVSAQKQTSGFINSETSDTEDTSHTNQFSGLATYGHSEGESGKIEELPEGRVKVTVVRGKKIFVIGSYWLWVKSGTVTIHSAIIPASKAIYRVDALSSYLVPTIEVLSESTEVELSSVNELLSPLAELNSVGMDGVGIDRARSTFSVLGHHFELPSDLVTQRQLDLSPWASSLEQIREFSQQLRGNDIGRSSVLVTGRRSTGATVFVRSLINMKLTQRHGSGKLLYPEVLLIDLDHELPEVAPLGTLSLALIKEPLIGPTTSQSKAALTILKLHFIGSLGSSAPPDLLAQATSDLAQIAQEYSQDTPIIIRVPMWMSSKEYDSFRSLWRALRLTQIVSTELGTSSALDDLAASDDIPLLSISSLALDNRSSTADEQKLRLRSYFHGHGFGNDIQKLGITSFTPSSSSRHVVSFDGPEISISATWLLDPLVSFDDTVDALLEGVGAIVAFSKDYFDDNLKAQIRIVEGSLPRLALSRIEAIKPSVSQCLGLAYVAEIQTDALEMVLYSPIPSTILRHNDDRVLVLVLPGRRQAPFLGSDWIARNKT